MDSKKIKSLFKGFQVKEPISYIKKKIKQLIELKFTK